MIRFFSNYVEHCVSCLVHNHMSTQESVTGLSWHVQVKWNNFPNYGKYMKANVDRVFNVGIERHGFWVIVEVNKNSEIT